MLVFKCASTPVLKPKLVLAVAALARSDRLLDGCRMSSAAAVMNTRALPDKLIAEPELELSLGVRDRVVPEAV